MRALLVAVVLSAGCGAPLVGTWRNEDVQPGQAERLLLNGDGTLLLEEPDRMTPGRWSLEDGELVALLDAEGGRLRARVPYYLSGDRLALPALFEESPNRFAYHTTLDRVDAQGQVIERVYELFLRYALGPGGKVTITLDEDELEGTYMKEGDRLTVRVEEFSERLWLVDEHVLSPVVYRR